MLAVATDRTIQQDRRRGARMRCMLQGRLAFNYRSSTLDCMVRNMTENGARLIFTDPVALPREFDLILDTQDRKFAAQLIWSTGLQAGVVFLAR